MRSSSTREYSLIVLETRFRAARWWSFKALSRLITLTLLATLLLPLPLASAADPVISTTWTISNGANSPPVYVDGVNFDPENDKFDFTVDMGTTGLEYDSVSFLDSSHMRFNFHGIALTGTITIQANASAYSPVESHASNTITLVVPAPLNPQSINFITPNAMKVKDPDQTPKATATSGLTVVLVSNRPSVCTIDFLKIHAVAAGTCSITATQNGNSIYAQAIPVTKTFEVSAITNEIPDSTTPPGEVVTNLGSVTYDPKNASGAYISVLVASKTLDPLKATPIKLLIPPDATNFPVVFLISSYSSDEENAAGYFVARIKSTKADGTLSLAINGAVEINIPAGAADSIPSWSLDGERWYKLKKIETEVLPPDYHAAYFVEKDGRIAIFSDYLMLFGNRKIQEPFRISSNALLIKPNVPMQISSSGGSGSGEIRFYTRTEDICTVTSSGLVTGLTEGKCIIAATKGASGIYTNAISSAISLYIQHDASLNPGSGNDPEHSTLCQELSYTLLKNSTLVYVNLCEEDAGESANLEVGTKSKTGIWSYKSVMKQRLDKNGVTLFKLEGALKVGQVIRVRAEGKIQISTTVR